MKTHLHSWIGTALVAVAVGLVGLSLGKAQSGGGAAAATFPRYSVISTDGTNLIVTDNQTNTLYYYTIDKDAQIGSELKLRGSGDLTQVGKPVIKPTLIK
jgi:hypothetical protein